MERRLGPAGSRALGRWNAGRPIARRHDGHGREDWRGREEKLGGPGEWQLGYSIFQGGAWLTTAPAGKYNLRCRTIDANGIAQPLPRPFAKAGGNSIQKLELTVEDA